jgi:polysaccharide pyruvyl transferase WcaK-like protein
MRQTRGLVTVKNQDIPRHEKVQPYPVGYLGWHGHGNMGDVAIRLTYERCLPQCDLRSLPESPSQIPGFLRATGISNLRHMHVLLGGGTVIGRRHYRGMLSGNMLIARGRPAVMVGAGVEDPVFQGRHSGSSNNELRNWKQLLSKFDRITVRGPRSAELLGDCGIEAIVVGDPALLLGAGPAVPNLQRVGVTVGFGSDLWAHDQRIVIQQVAEALAEAYQHNQEWQVRFLVVCSEDIEWTSMCAEALAALGVASETIIAIDPDVFMAEVATCNIFLGQRLHSTILACSFAVPCIMLEYQPKCMDFMRSIGREDWSLRTDQFTAGDLASKLTELSENRERHSKEIELQVALLRTKLEMEFDRISAVLS